MRFIDLYIDRGAHAIVQGLDAAAPLLELELIQGDKVQLRVHEVERVDADTTFREKPIAFTSIRASLCMPPDTAPDRGTFKLRVNGEDTEELTWPSDISSAALIAAWKLTVLNALKALDAVGADGIRADDPTGTPVNLLYFTWTDADRTDEIEVISNRLLPATEVTSHGSLTPVGWTQLLKFAQFPIVMSGAFTRDNPPTVWVTETRPGASGTNAEQTIIVPAGAVGSVSLVWDGASTKTMAVETITAESIEAALNAIVPDGATNPSFTVEQRRTREGLRFAVEFTGPLASAEQDLLAATMHDQETVPWASGILDLDRLRCELALNGAESVDVTLELVIQYLGEETYFLPVELQNDHTSGDTAASAEAAGSISVIERTVYVDAGLGEPFAEAAPGVSFIMPEPGSDFVCSHALNTRFPKVWTLHQVSADPEEWRQVPDNEIGVKSLGLTSFRVTFPFELSDDEFVGGDPNPLWRERWKVFAASPDTQIIVFAHKHLWDDVLQSLPSGMTLTEKLAALEASIGMVSGSLLVPVANISGQLPASKLDLISLVEALKTSTEFAVGLATIVNGADGVVAAIAERLQDVDEFVTTLTTLFSESQELQKSVLTSLTTAPEFRASVIAALQLGPGVNTSVVPITIPDFSDKLPAIAAALPAAGYDPADLGTITGYLPRADSTNANKFYTVSGRAYARPNKAKIFADGAKVFSTGSEWFEATVTTSGGHSIYSAKEYEKELFTIAVNEEMLTNGTVLTVAFAVTLQLIGNCEGHYLFELLRGHRVDSTGPGNLASIAWDETIISQKLVITDAAVTHGCVYTVTRASGGTMTAEKTFYTKTTATAAPADANIILRARLTQFDTENVTEPMGQLVRTMTGARASVAKVTT